MKVTIESEGLEKLAQKARSAKRDIEIEAKARALEIRRKKELRQKEWERQRAEEAERIRKQQEYEKKLEELYPAKDTLKFWLKVLLWCFIGVGAFCGVLAILSLIRGD